MNIILVFIAAFFGNLLGYWLMYIVSTYVTQRRNARAIAELGRMIEDRVKAAAEEQDHGEE